MHVCPTVSGTWSHLYHGGMSSQEFDAVKATLAKEKFQGEELALLWKDTHLC